MSDTFLVSYKLALDVGKFFLKLEKNFLKESLTEPPSAISVS